MVYTEIIKAYCTSINEPKTDALILRNGKRGGCKKSRPGMKTINDLPLVGRPLTITSPRLLSVTVCATATDLTDVKGLGNTQQSALGEVARLNANYSVSFQTPDIELITNIKISDAEFACLVPGH